MTVPVLSVQMTVVDPSASTASRWRARAPRLAMRVAPMARERVKVGSRPSGISATMTPSPKTNAVPGAVPMSREAAAKAVPAPTASSPRTRTAWPSWARRGVGRRTTEPVSREIAPSLVRAPVATTAAVPEPEVT